MEFVHFFSRDNARTPMQWSADANAGFTAGKSWLPVNENYKTCNAEVEDGDENSVLNYFRRLSNLRQHSDALLYGDYEELLKDDEKIFAFARSVEDKKIYVLVNFTLDEVKFPAEFLSRAKFIFGSCENNVAGTLRPLEAVIYEDSES